MPYYSELSKRMHFESLKLCCITIIEHTKYSLQQLLSTTYFGMHLSILPGISLSAFTKAHFLGVIFVILCNNCLITSFRAKLSWVKLAAVFIPSGHLACRCRHHLCAPCGHLGIGKPACRPSTPSLAD